MIDRLAKEFIQSMEEGKAIELIRAVRSSGFYNIGITLATFFEKLFPHSFDIKDEYAFSAVNSGNHGKAYDLFQNVLSMRGLTEDKAKKIIHNQHLCVDPISSRYSYYNPGKIRHLISRLNEVPRLFPQVTLTITSCKRLDLFEKTVNSFVNCCEDINLIDRWICVDDNSSPEDRNRMETMYPFFEFYLKTPAEKGHPQSMNIIRKLVETPYIFHMEDDWMFFCKRNYITDLMDVIGQNWRLMQCLVNKNYGETSTDIGIVGGEFGRTDKGIRYYTHEMVTTEESKIKWHAKNGVGFNCNYWPHFSFRPSLFRTRIFHELGEFNETVSHFEMDYAGRYVNKGWQSAFLESVYCLHIGRLTSERSDTNKPNAYQLNGEAQFEGKETQTIGVAPKTLCQTHFGDLKTFVINLDRREDRWVDFTKNAKGIEFLNYHRYSAIDGCQLISTPQLHRIFDGNDYNMRSGMVGCAMSHIKLYVELLNSDDDAYCILEDDLEFAPDFREKFTHMYNKVRLFDWDIVYLGHHLFKDHITADSYDKTKMPKIEKWSCQMSFSRSMGGTGGYVISKKGAQRMLDFINTTGMTNGIDTVQQKAADLLNIFYITPHLIYSECFRGDNNPDTDIQYNYESLTISVKERLNTELSFYEGKAVQIYNSESAFEIVKNAADLEIHYYEDEDPVVINQLEKECVHPCYTLDDKVLIVVPGGHNERYFNRLCKNGKFNILDALQTK